MRCCRYLFTLLLVVATSGCSDFFVSESATNSVTLNPTNLFMKVGETKQFTATAVTVGGSSTDVSSTATWNSSSTSIATVSTSGLVTAVASGNTVVTASSGGSDGTANITVNTQALTSLAISPSNPSVAPGSTQQLSAVGTFADGSTQDLTTRVTWASGSTANATVDSAGLVTGVASGSSTVTASLTATSGAVTASTTVNVTVF